MIPVVEQISSGRLVCPLTRARLERRGEGWATLDGSRVYPDVRGVPILLSDREQWREFRDAQDSAPAGAKRLIHRVLAIGGDHRTVASMAAFRIAIADQPPGSLCISVGGGPARAHASLVNVNIGPFPGVDVVGDAHHLPYADGSVDAIFCEAVLEHLERPDAAVAEMRRVLRRGGQVFAATPFLQRYHGHPDHYQNFTLTGHRRLFERAGFNVLDCGTCVGPTYALTMLGGDYLREFVPTRALSRLAWALFGIASVPLRYIDRVLPAEAAHVLASTTYVRAVVP